MKRLLNLSVYWFLAEHNTNDMSVKRIAYLNRRAPYGTAYAFEALESVLAAAAFEQEVALIFTDDGVYQLLDNQNPNVIDMKNPAKAYLALEGYDIERIYISKKALEERGLSADDLVIPVEVLSDIEIAELLSQQDAVLSF